MPLTASLQLDHEVAVSGEVLGGQEVTRVSIHSLAAKQVESSSTKGHFMQDQTGRTPR